ncbi:MAG: Rab family GTPase [Candidatus Thermoplasmatota archaeon]
MAEEPKRLKAKVCLVGEHGVGKTSLIRRYVLDEFDDRYIVTLGAKVSKREMMFTMPGRGDVHMDMTVWDIMGSKGFRELLREAYFHGAQGIIAACDLTRFETLHELDDWIEAVFRTVKPVPIVFAVNKADLEDRTAFGEPEVREAAAAFGAPYYFTSAKTGQQVEIAFRELGSAIAKRAVPLKP